MSTLYAGERLDHPAIARTLDLDGAIRFAITGALTHDAASVLGKLVRLDLLAARGRERGEHRTAFILDLGDCPEITPQALGLLLATSKLVLGELGTLTFDKVDDDLYDLLVVTKFANVFTLKRS